MWINNHWYTESKIKDLLYVKDKRIKELTKALGEKFEVCGEVKPNFYCGAGKLTKEYNRTIDDIVEGKGLKPLNMEKE